MKKERTYYPFSCAPVFSMVMQDEDLCRRFLERVLGTEVGEITYHAIEHEASPALDARSVRLDAYLKSEGAVYNIEMQASSEPYLGRRLRYYQSAIDATELPSGVAVGMLPESYIIFVCDFDPYNSGIPVYDIERTCAQDPSVAVGDGSHWRVLNASAWQDEPDEGLRTLLQYVLDGKASDELTCELDAVVAGINSDSRRWQKVDGFMSQEMNWANRVYAARQEGLAEGEAKGEARMAELFDRLAAADRVPDYAKATKDAAYRDSLMREFGLA